MSVRFAPRASRTQRLIQFDVSFTFRALECETRARRGPGILRLWSESGVGFNSTLEPDLSTIMHHSPEEPLWVWGLPLPILLQIREQLEYSVQFQRPRAALPVVGH